MTRVMSLWGMERDGTGRSERDWRPLFAWHSKSGVSTTKQSIVLPPGLDSGMPIEKHWLRMRAVLA